MKTYYLFIIFALAAFACEPPQPSTPEITLEEIEAKELASGKRCDTIFLKFTLGSSYEEFYDHVRELEESKTILVDDEDFYYYPVKCSNKYGDFVTDIYFKPLFVGDSLYTLTLTFTDENNVTDYELTSCIEEQILITQYGKPSYYDENVGSTYFVKGNRKIEKYLRGKIIYTNLEIQQRIENYKKNEEKKDLARRKSEF